jgi:Holliday junction DNA helicase RuvB
LSVPVRPANLSEYIGQSDIRPVLENAIRLAKTGKRLFPNTLLYGGPGLGKSSLAAVLAREAGLILLNYTAGKDWTGVRLKHELLNLNVKGYGPGGKWQAGAPRYLLFVDEVHCFHSTAYEALYSPLEDLEVHDNGTVYWLPDTSFVFATTKPSTLPKPFLDRLSLQLHLSPYSVEELGQIIRRLHPGMTPGVVAEVAKRSCGVARLAINYAQSVEDYPGGLDWFSIMKIDEAGLNEWHRRYLEVLERADGRPVSLTALASVLRETPDVVKMLEEELVRQDRIIVTAHGRLLAGVIEGRGPKDHG